MFDDLKLELNDAQFEDALSESFHQANEVLAREFASEITSNKWSWPQGESPRDIVDEGTLRDVGTNDRVGKTEHEHTWNTKYAMAVHEGATFGANTRPGKAWSRINADGSPRMPGRPWTQYPLETGVLERALERLARIRLEQIQ